MQTKLMRGWGAGGARPRNTGIRKQVWKDKTKTWKTHRAQIQWYDEMTWIQSSSAWDLKAVCGSSTEGFDGRLNHPAMTLCLTYEGRFATLSVLIQVPHVCFAFTRIQFSDILNTMKSTAYILTNPGTSWIWGKTLKRFDSGHEPASAVLEGCSHLLFNN